MKVIGAIVILTLYCTLIHGQVYLFDKSTFVVEPQYNRSRLADEFGTSFLFSIRSRVALQFFAGYHEKANGLDGYVVTPGLEVAVLKAKERMPGFSVSSSFESIQFTTSSPSTRIFPQRSFATYVNIFLQYDIDSDISLFPVLSIGSYFQGILNASEKGIIVGLQPVLLYKKFYLRSRLFYSRQNFFGGVGVGITF